MIASALSSVVPKFPPTETNVDDAKRFPDMNLTELRRLRDLVPLLGDEPLQDVPVRSVLPSRAGGFTIEIGEPTLKRQASLGRAFTPDVLEALIDVNKIILGWTPVSGEWRDIGTFFKEAAEFSDPIQSGLADCWLIAAMSSVAWAKPYAFAQRSRATGTGNEQFKNLLSFTDPDTNAKKDFEVTDATVVFAGTSSPMYARSSEPGEIWPGLIEKAFAQWRANTTHDRPNMTVVEYGDCVWATAAIIGGTRQTIGTSVSTTTQLANFVKTHCVDHRTVHPMTCWTYGSDTDAPDEISYSDANIVGNHCYSILGWIRGSSLLDIVDVDLKLYPTRTRLPFRYGIVEMRGLPHLIVTLTAEINGQEQQGDVKPRKDDVQLRRHTGTVLFSGHHGPYQVVTLDQQVETHRHNMAPDQNEDQIEDQAMDAGDQTRGFLPHQ